MLLSNKRAFADLPLPIITNVVDRLQVRDLLHLALTCRALYGCILPYPFEFTVIRTYLWSSRLWKLLSDRPALAAHVRMLAIDPPRDAPYAVRVPRVPGLIGDDMLDGDNLPEEDEECGSGNGEEGSESDGRNDGSQGDEDEREGEPDAELALVLENEKAEIRELKRQLAELNHEAAAISSGHGRKTRSLESDAQAQRTFLEALKCMRHLEFFKWEGSFDGPGGFDYSEEFWPTLAVYCRQLKALQIDMYGSWQPYAKMWDRLGGLHCLQAGWFLDTVHPTSWITSMGTMLLDRCPSLTKLDIDSGYDESFYRHDINFLFADPTVWPNLTHLSLMGFDVDNSPYIAFLEHHPKLEHLHIDWDFEPPGTPHAQRLNLSLLSHSALPNLRSFSTWTISSKQALHILGHGRPLRKIQGFQVGQRAQNAHRGAVGPVEFFDKLAACAPVLEWLSVNISSELGLCLERLSNVASGTLKSLDLLAGAKLPPGVPFPSFPVLETLDGMRLGHIASPDGRLAGLRSGREAIARLHDIARACPKLKSAGYTEERNSSQILALKRNPDGSLDSWTEYEGFYMEHLRKSEKHIYYV